MTAALTQAKRTTLQGTDLVADIQAVLDLSQGKTSESQGVSAASESGSSSEVVRPKPPKGQTAHIDTLLRRMERLR